MQQALTAHDAEANALLSRMTLDEKIGQMTQAEQDALVRPSDVETYFLGSLLSGGDSNPKSGNTLADWRRMVDEWQARALHTRLAIPLLYGIDAVHGHNNLVGAVVFPHQIGMGCTRNPVLVEKAARVTALEVRASGINWTFAPCVTVPQDLRWGRTYEGYGETPDLARMLGEVAVRGFQGPQLGPDPTRVLACAKHFVGDGGTVYGTGMKEAPPLTGKFPLDRGDTRLSEQELRDLHMQGYIGALEAGVGSIMPSYSSWNGEKCSGSHRLLTEILKQELGFEGFLISDYNALDELPGNRKAQIEKSINAGMDMVMVPKHYREFIGALRELVQEGRVPLTRIDDAVRRILRVKIAMGLLDRGRHPFSDRKLEAQFGAVSHRALARECVRQSLVLLKNKNHTLPIAKDLRRVHVAGKSADNLGYQCGGWTIDWQGAGGPITEGTTILQAVRRAVSKNTEVTYSINGAGAAGTDVGIVVIGEPPYAEMKGDRETLDLAPEDAAAIDALKKAGVPVVAVLLSGRPLVLGKSLDQCDAFVAAWLPGTEGDGVADILFGDYRPTGRLSFSWPRSTADLPLRDTKKTPLFPYGFGLSN